MTFHDFIILIKDTLKAFDDFRNKDQKCMIFFFFFLISKSMYILKVYSVHYAVR